MPRLTAVTAPAQAGTAVEFIVSVPLDLTNAMYFTHLVEASEGVEGWPVQVRRQMAPDLLAELDFLYGAPIEQPGIAGTLGDHLWEHPETWGSVEDLVSYVRNLPLGVRDERGNVGVHGLFFNTFCGQEHEPDADVPHSREKLVARLERAGRDPEPVLALWDNPEQVRERLANLIERFYNEHYKATLPDRLNCLERSAAAHRGTTIDNVVEKMRTVLNRETICLETSCSGPFTKLLFAPSIDMGPWASCAILPEVHGMFYPCEARFVHGDEAADETTLRMARIHKALGDEQRLRMLEMLRGGEMYVQEIVDRTGLHQSVVSRHLSFLKVVGLLTVRKQNNMKFYSLAPDAARYLQKTLDMFPATTVTGGSR